MIEQIVVAAVIATLVGLVLVYLLGPFLKALPGPFGAIVGAFFIQWGWVLGLLVGLLAFFSGWSILGFGGRRG